MDRSSLQNLVDYRLNLTAKPSSATSLALDVHQQYLETTNDYWYNVAGVPRNTAGTAVGSGKGFGINPGYSSDLGQEVDLIGGWTVHRGVLLEAGLGTSSGATTSGNRPRRRIEGRRLFLRSGNPESLGKSQRGPAGGPRDQRWRSPGSRARPDRRAISRTRTTTRRIGLFIRG